MATVLPSGLFMLTPSSQEWFAVATNMKADRKNKRPFPDQWRLARSRLPAPCGSQVAGCGGTEPDEDTVRIISAREATRREQSLFRDCFATAWMESDDRHPRTDCRTARESDPCATSKETRSGSLRIWRGYRRAPSLRRADSSRLRARDRDQRPHAAELGAGAPTSRGTGNRIASNRCTTPADHSGKPQVRGLSRAKSRAEICKERGPRSRSPV